MGVLRWGLKKLPLRGCVARVETAEPVVALTFDDGPDPRFTPLVLELLERYDALGTFFMLGSSAAQHPDLVRRVAEAGHVIANHTWDHPTVARISWKVTRSQIRACQQAIEPYGVRMFRPPYLALSKSALLTCRMLGYEVILANVFSTDWWNPSGSAIAETLLADTKPGDIVLLHDGLAGFTGRDLPHTPLPDRSVMLAGLEEFLARTAGRFRFVTVPALMAEGRTVRKKRYSRGPALAAPE